MRSSNDFLFGETNLGLNEAEDPVAKVSRLPQGEEPVSGRIVIIDDQLEVLTLLRNTITQDPNLLISAACRCGDGAILAVQQYQPTVVILDVALPDRDGIALIRDVTAISAAKVVVFTAELSELEAERVLQSGARAIVFKDQPISMLMSCVREILIEERRDTEAAPRNAVMPPRESSLSPREQEVAQWAAAGARNKEIAWRLGITEGTEKLHLFHIYRKLNVSNRVGLSIAFSGATQMNEY